MRKNPVVFKKMFFSSFLFLFFVAARAQSNLQFNQVIRLGYTGSVASNSSPAIAGSFTVPANKVWKIESGSAVDSARLFTLPFSLTVDGQLLYSGHSSGSSMPFYVPAPIWLGPGTYQVTVALITGFNQSFMARISALEFNVIP